MPPLPPASTKIANQLAYTRGGGKNASTVAKRPALAQILPTPPFAAPSVSDREHTGLVTPLTPAPSSRSSPEKLPTAGRHSARKSKDVKKSTAPSLHKLFVLDTNVLLHDPSSLFRFEDNDLFIPLIVLEELDNHKKGMTEVARNGRQVSRQLDALVAAHSQDDITQGLLLSSTGQTLATGKLYFQAEELNPQTALKLPIGKADNQILAVVQALSEKHPERPIVLVSKDINMRVKARALRLRAEDYENDKVLEDGDLLYTGYACLETDFWEKQGKNLESWVEGGHTFYRIKGKLPENWFVGQFLYQTGAGASELNVQIVELQTNSATLKTIKDFGHQKNNVWGVLARNREQNFAINLLMDPEVDFVTLAGTAGTGKTLLALACGLKQVLDERRYSEIIMTRATINVGEDIGFLPGTEEEKMGPWMGALDDNLEFLGKMDTSSGEWGRAATNDLIRSKVKIKSLNFMRGRTFLSKYLIIDEAQNLTPKQIKTLVTRAGPGTKIVCMGNLAQIDTPYLTEGASGLTYAVDRFKSWAHAGHVTLARGERSRLADFASSAL